MVGKLIIAVWSFQGAVGGFLLSLILSIVCGSVFDSNARDGWGGVMPTLVCLAIAGPTLMVAGGWGGLKFATPSIPLRPRNQPS